MSDPTTTRSQGWTWPHLVDRALERYGLALTPSHVDEIKRQINGGRARYVGASRRGADVWEVRLVGQSCRVVYNAKKDLVLTFLP